MRLVLVGVEKVSQYKSMFDFRFSMFDVRCSVKLAKVNKKGDDSESSPFLFFRKASWAALRIGNRTTNNENRASKQKSKISISKILSSYSLILILLYG